MKTWNNPVYPAGCGQYVYVHRTQEGIAQLANEPQICTSFEVRTVECLFKGHFGTIINSASSVLCREGVLFRRFKMYWKYVYWTYVYSERNLEPKTEMRNRIRT